MSPIKGLTDIARPRWPSLGKLRKGSEKGQNRPGRDLDYFRFTSDRPEVEAAFIQEYGETPRELAVYLPLKHTEEVFATWQEHWEAGGLVHRCDGEHCVIWREGSEYVRADDYSAPKPCPGDCKPVGRLEVLLFGLFQHGFVGTVTLETHSLNDIQSIHASLLQTEEKRGDAGLEGIEFILSRRRAKVSTPGEDGKRARREMWLVYLEPSAKWVAGYFAAQEKPTALPAPETQKTEPKEEMLKEEEPAGYASWPKKDQDRFWARARGIADADDATIHRAFGVESMKNYPWGQKTVKLVFDILAYGLSKTLNLDQIEKALGGAIVGWDGTLDEAQEMIRVWQANEAGDEEEDDQVPF